MSISNVIRTRIKQKKNSLDIWNTVSADHILLDGELAVVDCGEFTKFKIGNGISTFIQLPYSDQEVLSTNLVDSHAIVQGISAHSSDYGLASGRMISANADFSQAFGCNTAIASSDTYAFAWSGDDTRAIGNYYSSHGKGTFSINPLSGLSGFYIGDKSLSSHLDDFYREKVPYSLVELYPDENSQQTAVDRAMNHMTEQFNMNGPWTIETPNDDEYGYYYNTIISEDIQLDSSAMSIDGSTPTLEYNGLYLQMYNESYSSIAEIPTGEYTFIGNFDSSNTGSNIGGELSITYIDEYNVMKHGGSFYGQLYWQDPNDIDPETDMPREYYEEVEGTWEWGSFYFTGLNDYGINGNGYYDDQYGSGLDPNGITIQSAYDSNSNEITQYAQLYVQDVYYSNIEANGSVDVELTIDSATFNFSSDCYISMSYGDIYISIQYLPMEFDSGYAYTQIYAYGSGYSDLPSTGDTFSIDPSSSVGIALTVSHTAGIIVQPPTGTYGKARDFILAIEAETDGLNVDLSGVKGVDEDTFTLEPGLNMLYVTEPIQDQMYAVRKMFDVPQS